MRVHFILTLESLQALSSSDIPNLDGRVGIPRHQDVVLQLHAWGETLMTNQRV